METLVIQTDVTDWLQEVMQNETVLTDEDSIIQAIEAGATTGHLAKAAVVNTEIGNLPRGIIGDSKSLIYSGAVADVSGIVKKVKITFETESGKSYQAHAYVGRVREKAPDNGKDEPQKPEASYVSIESAEALERAEKYLMNVIPGHAFERFKTIYLNGGDVMEAASELCQRIYRVAGRLVDE